MPPTQNNPRKYLNDLKAFLDDLSIRCGGEVRQFSEVMAEFQRERFDMLNHALLAIKVGKRPTIGRYWIEATKGASKDTDIAACLLWLMAFTERPITIQIGAADKDQADELRKAAKEIIAENHWLTKVIKVQSGAIVNQISGSRAEILTSDASGSHGARPDVLILNELTHITNREFAETLLDNASKVPEGLVIIMTNAGHDPSWQFEWRHTAMTSERWDYHVFDEPSPWLDPLELKEARGRNSPNRYARLWSGKWVGRSGDALDMSDVLRCVTLPGPTHEIENGWSYYATLDLGLKKDASALAIMAKHIGWTEERPRKPIKRCSVMNAMIDLGMLEPAFESGKMESVLHYGTNKIRLINLQIWQAMGNVGKIDIQPIEESILASHDMFNLNALFYDPWQSEYLAERLRKQGVICEPVNFVPETLKSMAYAVLEAFTEKTVELYHDENLLNDLKALRIVEKGYGQRLDSPRGLSGHGDSATALAIGLHAARMYEGSLLPNVSGELIVYPN